MSSIALGVDLSIDRWILSLEKVLKEMPDLRCERHIVLMMNGYGKNPACQTLASVSDLDTEFTFCPGCYRDFETGRLDAIR